MRRDSKRNAGCRDAILQDTGAVPAAAILSAGRRFSRYAPIEERQSSSAKSPDNPALRRICHGYLDFIGQAQGLMDEVMMQASYGGPIHSVGGDIDFERYLLAASAASGLRPAPVNVEAFCIMLGGMVDSEGNGKTSFYMREYAGYYISALINYGRGAEFRIPTAHLGFDLAWLGYMNRKRIGILGNAGRFLGCRMRSGMIGVEGSADNPGLRMRGGLISISGDARSSVASGMMGGEIHIWGEIGAITDVQGGRIYHMGNLVVDK